jgi:hypothetical protein
MVLDAEWPKKRRENPKEKLTSRINHRFHSTSTLKMVPSSN